MRRSASTSTCRSSRARPGCSSRCGGLTTAIAICAWSTVCAPRCRTSRWARTSSSASGRDEEDYQTLEVVEVRYDSAFTFVYSPRAGTEAAAMPDQVPDDKRERIEQLVDVVQRIAAERNAERVGRVEEVLVEGPSRTDPTLLRGRTRRNTTVNFVGAAARDLVDVLVEGSTSTTLRGRETALIAA